MSDCIFCKLANGEIPTMSVYEDEVVKVIFDAAPATKGHLLVIPKGHYENVFEIPEDVLGKAYGVAKKVAQALKDVTGCDGVNILQNNGEAAGQTVFHLHIHVIPRYKGDGVNINWKPGEQDKEYLEDLAKKLSL